MRLEPEGTGSPALVKRVDNIEVLESDGMMELPTVTIIIWG